MDCALRGATSFLMHPQTSMFFLQLFFWVPLLECPARKTKTLPLAHIRTTTTEEAEEMPNLLKLDNLVCYYDRLKPQKVLSLEWPNFNVCQDVRYMSGNISHSASPSDGLCQVSMSIASQKKESSRMCVCLNE